MKNYEWVHVVGTSTVNQTMVISEAGKVSWGAAEALLCHIKEV